MNGTRTGGVLVCALLTVLAFVQDPGKIAPDTKLDLTQDPGGFLHRALDLWDPSGFAGQLQNQAYGYLFPMGPFFAAGDAVGLPEWVVQRLWWAMLLCVAFTGMYVLARKLGIGTPSAQLIAAVAYALSPRILSTLGPVSAEAWPMALAPWVVVPLVLGAEGGSYRRRALLSGLVVAAMGGVNAALVLAAVAPAGLYLVTREPDRRSWRLLGWWLLSVIAATAWWVRPLLILGSYSPPFLDYIESASVTTDPTSLAEVVRGASHWVGYLGPGLGSPWRAGHDLVTEPALILNTVVVAAIGLAGLTLRRLPERGWLIAMLLVGAVALTFGHAGPGTGWFAGAERDALDGLLAPLRNVHKFDPLLRIPLVLGLAHLIGVLVRQARDDASRTVAWAVAVMTGLAVVGGAGPAIAGRVAPEGSYEAVPRYWQDAAHWLDEHADGRALLAPGSRFGVYYWGATNDEPLQALTDASWEVRNAIPLVPAGHIRLLDAVERRFAAGQPSDGLAEYLARAGIGHVVVRNDLDQARLGTARPVLVHEVLEHSPGFTRVAEFGPDLEVEPGPDAVVDHGLQPTYPAVEIWAVGEPPDSVSVTPLSEVTTVVGGPESLLDLADADALPPGPTLLAADEPDWSDTLPAVLTDGLRRREINFGASLDNASATLTARDPLRLDQPAHDYRGGGDERYETVADWLGVRDVAVSSSGSDAGAWGGSRPSRQPAAAFDRRAATAWLADPAYAGEPAWMRVDLDEPADVDLVRVRLPRAADSVREIVVRTDAATHRAPVGSRRWVPIDVDPTPTSEVTVELRGPSGAKGIAELRIPGVRPRHVIRTPDVLAQPPTAIVLSAPTGTRAGCVEAETVVCAPGLARQGEEDTGLEREVSVAATSVYELSARAAARPKPALDRWLTDLAGLDVEITASSSGVRDPSGGPLAAIDGQPSTGWVAGPFDAEPILRLRWTRRTPIDTVRLIREAGLPASAPGRVVVETDSGRYDVAVADDGSLAGLPPQRTRRLTLRLHDPIRTSSFDPTTGRTVALPIGVSEIEINGDSVGAELSDDRTIRLPCGQGPDVVVDGRTHRTEARTTVPDLLRLHPVRARLCEPTGDDDGDATPELTLTGGDHQLSVLGTPRWRPLGLTLANPAWQPDRAADEVATTIVEWGRSQRRIDVESRAAPALLAVPENANDGWTATLGGQRLEPVTVDGWQQGFVVPQGSAGTIELRYGPTTGYRAALAIGAGLVAVLAAGALLDRRRPTADLVGPRRWPRWLPWAAAVVALGCLGGAAGLAVALLVGVSRTLVGRWRRLGATTVESAWAAVTFGAYGAAGALLAWRPAGSDDYAGDWWATQILALVAVAMTAMAALTTASTTTASTTTASTTTASTTTRPAGGGPR